MVLSEVGVEFMWQMIQSYNSREWLGIRDYQETMRRMDAGAIDMGVQAGRETVGGNKSKKPTNDDLQAPSRMQYLPDDSSGENKLSECERRRV